MSLEALAVHPSVSRSSLRTTAVTFVAAAAGLLANPASAVDLSVSNITVVQSVQLGNTPLVAGRAAMIRVTVGVSGATGSVAGVDALLRITVDGVPQPWSPIFSVNGPINAPVSSNPAVLDHTLNFFAVLPESGDVDIVAEVDPLDTIAETNEANNSVEKKNLFFQCRRIVDLAYVPINYVPGAGLPDSAYMEPGIGDGFVRAIYGPEELNYHRAPLPPLVWTQDVNTSSTALLNALQDILLNQIPATGAPQPDFMYGWLAGNPYSGNGRANGIPGDTAFGNTDPARFQRTFAHELGHLVGLEHNNATIATNGIDVEHHLLDTQGLAQLFPTTKKDVMVAGQLTNSAFVREASLSAFLNDNRVKCPPMSPLQGGGRRGEDDAPLLRVCGTIGHDLPRTATLDPLFFIDGVTSTRDDLSGDLLVVARDGDGEAIWGVRTDTRRTQSSCGGDAAIHSHSPFYVMIPSVIGGSVVASVDVVDLLGQQQVVASRSASAHPPMTVIGSVETIEGGVIQGGPEPLILKGIVRVSWTAGDADADPLTHHVFYSADDGASWLPVAVNVVGDSVEFDSAYLPSTRGLAARFRVRTTDGFGSVDSPVLLAAALGTGAPPDVHLLSPNDQTSHKQSGAIILHASAWDLEDRYLDESAVTWTSSIDGPIAVGRLAIVDSLSPGMHLLTVTGVDTDGMSTSKSTTITVVERNVLRSPDLNDDGTIDGEDLGLLLASWGGTGAADLDFSGTIDGADLGLLIAMWE